MRLDPFVKITNNSSGSHFHNYRTGKNYFIKTDLMLKINPLFEKGSFSEQDWPENFKILNDLLEDSFLIQLSGKDLEKNIIDSSEIEIENTKLTYKKVALLLDYETDIFCNYSAIDKRKRKETHSVKEILEKIKEINLSETLTIFSTFKNVENIIKTINKAKEEKLNITEIFFSDKELSDTEKIFNKLEQITNLPLTIYYLDENSVIKTHLINKAKIEIDENIFADKNPFLFCPYLYKYIFINLEGEIDFCQAKLRNNKSGLYNIFDKSLYGKKKIIGMQNFCDNKKTFSEQCRYSILCSKYCAMLSEEYNACQKHDEENCAIPKLIDNYINY